MVIYFWQDYTWCTSGNLDDYLTFYNNDFNIIYVQDNFDDDDIDEVVRIKIDGDTAKDWLCGF